MIDENLIREAFLKKVESNSKPNTDMDFDFEDTQISFQGRFLYKIFKEGFEAGYEAKELQADYK